MNQMASLNIILLQDMEMGMKYGGMVHCQFGYPPLELEDFPHVNLSAAETTLLKPEILTEDDMSYEKLRDYMNITVEEIFSLCSSQDNNSIALSSMQD